jgi:SAM-dependent methyltransferase
MTAQVRDDSAASVLPFSVYAEVYDLLYADKDYAAEAAFVANLLQRFLSRAPAQLRIVDLACGTGRHAIELASIGFPVTASDVSSDMVSIARAAAQDRSLPIPFHIQSFQNCSAIGGKYDAALAMFASLGYLLSTADLVQTLSCVRALLAPGGYFLFDVWNGQAVVKDYAPIREKRASNAALNVKRISRTTLDEDAQVATVRFEFELSRRGSSLDRFAEVHRVHYFFPEELKGILEAQGFEVLLRCPFREPSRALTPNDWNMTFVVRPA